MTAYVPPYPPRPLIALPAFALLRLARRNLIAIWPEETFVKPVFAHQLLRRSVVFANSPETVKQSFVDGAEFLEQKSAQQRNALRPLIGDGLFISHGAIWRERRKQVASVTHVSRLPELSKGISAAAWKEAVAWRARPPGRPIDALASMAQLTASVICSAIFGRDIGDTATREIVTAFGVYQRLIGQTDIFSLLGLPDLVPRLQGFRIRLAARRIHRTIDTLVARIGIDRDGEPSLLRAMSRPNPDGADASVDAAAFRNEAAVLFMAGHETTANTLAWVWFLLSQDAATEQRLHAEVDAVVAADGPARFEDLARLPFTRAVVEETLRLYPPVPLQARQATGAMTVGDRSVKSGDLVILNAWTLHRHRLLWEDADAFKPDRFMPGGSGIPSRYAYVPFSIGPRVCTGAAFGLTEAVLCLATLARQYRLRLEPGHVVEPVCRLSLRPGDRLPMLIEARR